MITITQRLARQLRTMFRRGLNLSSKSPLPNVRFRDGPDGLRISCQHSQAAIEFHSTEQQHNEELLAPYQLLADCEARRNSLVTIQQHSQQQIKATWEDAGNSQTVKYDIPKAQVTKHSFPHHPKMATKNPAQLLAALHDAMETVDRKAVRYATNCIRLEGEQGRILATDTKQILVQEGYTFPFVEGVLVPWTNVFGCAEWPKNVPVAMGKTDDWLSFQAGSWTLHFVVNKPGRFPKLDSFLVSSKAALATVQITEQDAEFLVNTIKHLPISDDVNAPITVDLNGTFSIRAAGKEPSQPTELILTHADVTGRPIRINSNRNYLDRAAKLGFREVCVHGAESPIVCRDENRWYVWAALEKENAIKPTSKAVRIASGENSHRPQDKKPSRKRIHSDTKSHKLAERKQPQTMTQAKANTNGKITDSGNRETDNVSVEGLIEQSAVTPLEIVHSGLDLRRTATLFLTAGGSNPDILGAFKKTAEQEPGRLGILCMKKNSPLARSSKEYSDVDRFEFRLPAGKDGFLATNSLLATSILLARGYQNDHATAEKLPQSLTEVAYQGQDAQKSLSGLEGNSAALWERKTLIVLYGPSTHAAAIDLESKFAEATLGQIQLSDFRNFAHGRHHWLAKNGDTAALISFVTDDVRNVAQKTIALIPANVPRLEIDLGTPGPTAAIGGIVNTLHLVGLIGKHRDFDPGRPHIPEFGRQIYHLKAFPVSRRRKAEASPLEKIAINRKLQSASPDSGFNGQITKWKAAYEAFVKKLARQRFGAIVCDYDGTLCDQTERFTEPRTEVFDYLISLLKSGIRLGVVSGRGTSLREALRRGLPRRYWESVILGYYNGAEIGELSDNERPNNRPHAGRQLSSIARLLAKTKSLTEMATIDIRDKQISIVPQLPSYDSVCWDLVQSGISRQTVRGLRAFRSGHSIDIVAPTVSKKNLVQNIRQSLSNMEHKILCIEDRGRWPGNDSELLMEPFSLSVDEVSSATESCWNLASPGIRHVEAVLEYFGEIEIKNSYFRYSASTEAPA